MAEMSQRLRARLARDFPAPSSAPELIRLVEVASDSERVQAAIVLAARGDLGMIRHGVALAAEDWRDVLVNGGLENEDWPAVLDRELGPDG